MIEVRRIDDAEAGEVAALWDQLCRETVGAGPLTADGRRSIARMLAASAWHADSCCMVAVQPGEGVVGFAVAELERGTGLLPGPPLARFGELYVAPDHRDAGVARLLAEAVVEWAIHRGAAVLRAEAAHDDLAGMELWSQVGFVADVVCLSRYLEVVSQRRCK